MPNGSIPKPRLGHSAVNIGDKMLVFGGHGLGLGLALEFATLLSTVFVT